MPGEKYHISIRIIHWSMALIIIGMIALGMYMSDLPKENPLKGQLVGLHKSFGALVLGLLFVRIIFRIATKVPALPDSMPKTQRILAGVGHKFLYLLMFGSAASGYAMSNLYGYGVSLFGIPLPKIFPDNRELAGIAHEAHSILPYVMLAIIIIHVAAVVKHRFFDKPENDVLGRML